MIPKHLNINMLNISAIKQVQMATTVSSPSPLAQYVNTVISIGKDAEKLNPSYTVQLVHDNSVAFPRKV